MSRSRTVALLALALVLPTACTSSLLPADGAPPETAADVGLPWWNDRVFYEVRVRDWSDSDGDGIGDLGGLLGHLDNLNDGDPNTASDLGVTGLLLSDVLASNSDLGDDVVDYRSIDPALGGLDELRDVIDAAHERGMAVIIDLNLNHTSIEHPWFQASLDGRLPDYYLWSNQQPNQSWHPARRAFFYGVFGDTRPDLNLVNREVGEELVDVGEFWLTDVGIDGFRLREMSDYVETVDGTENTDESKAWAAEYDDRLDAFVPNSITVGEIRGSTREAADWIGPVDLVLDTQRGEAITSSLERAHSAELLASQRELGDRIPDAQYGIMLGETTGRLAGAGAIRVAAVLLLTERGVPFTRLSLTDDAELTGLYRTLIEIRNETPALRLGSTSEVTADTTQVYAFLRHLDDHQVLVICNLGESPVSDVQLTFDPSLLADDATPRFLLGSGSPRQLPARSATDLVWSPVDVLAGYESVIIRFD